MATRTISARQAVADIRSGMDDSALMKKYSLAPDGLQSLFDKLVTAGFIDISELQGRLPGFLGTVSISNTIAPERKPESKEIHPLLKDHSSAWVNVQEAARDIRSGMGDSALMAKYRLSSRGLQSLFNKLLGVGAIAQLDLDRRSVGFDHTVSLKEDSMSFSAIMKVYEAQEPEATPRTGDGHKQAPPDRVVRASAPRKPAPVSERVERKPPAVRERVERKPQAPKRVVPPPETGWYDNALVVIALLIGLFPLGFYALYQNSTLSAELKAFLIIAWSLLAVLALAMLVDWRMGWMLFG